MRHVPEWFPGAGFQVFARHFRTLHEEALEEPVKEVEKNMVRVRLRRALQDLRLRVIRAGRWECETLHCGGFA